MDNKIIIVPYDPMWPTLFLKAATNIRKSLKEIAIRIDHIGSTSIKNQDAKPIIDIQISVESFNPLYKFQTINDYKSLLSVLYTNLSSHKYFSLSFYEVIKKDYCFKWNL